MAANSGVVGVLRALLTADTAQFDTAMRKAGITAQTTQRVIEGLGKEVINLTPQAERMAKAFGGDRLISTANNLISAVQKIGGVSKLTAAEQRRFNGTVSEAIEKMRALGIEAPRAWLKVEHATRSAGSATDLFQAKMVAIGAAVGTFASNLAITGIRTLTDYGKSAFTAANNLLDLSAKTGQSTDALQRMQFVGNKIGVSLETMSDSAFRLSANIAGGEKSVAFAVQKLGLNLQEVQAMKPEQQFETIVDALGKVDDQGARNRLGIQLFGRSFNEIAAAVAQNYKSMADAATVTSRQQLEALSRQQSRWNEFKSNLHTSVIGVIGDLVLMAEAWNMAKAPRFQSFAETIEAYHRIRAELEKGNIELPSNTKNLDLNADAMNRTSTAADELAKHYAHIADLSAQAFGLDKVAQVRDMVEAIGGMAGVVLMDADQLKNLNKLMGDAIDAAQRNGQIVPLEWLKIEDATRSAADGLQEFIRLQQQLGNIPPPERPPLEPIDISIDVERMRKVLEQNAPGSRLHHAAEQVGESVGASMKQGIGRAFEQVPHFLTSSIIHSGSFINGLKAIGVDMADAIVEPLIKRFIARMAGARLISAIGAGTAVGSAATAAAGTAAAVGGATAAGAAGSGAATAAAGGGGIGGTLAAFATNPFTLAAVGAAVGGVLLFRHFRGGNRANDIRDKDLAQFAGFDTAADKADTANPPGFHGLARLLTKYGKGALFGPFATAHDPGSVRRSFEPIQAFVGSLGRSVKSFQMGGFVPPGVVQPAIVHGGQWGEDITPRGPNGPGGGVYITVHNHISAIDAAGVKSFVESPAFLSNVGNVIERNTGFIATRIERSRPR